MHWTFIIRVHIATTATDRGWGGLDLFTDDLSPRGGHRDEPDMLDRRAVGFRFDLGFGWVWVKAMTLANLGSRV